MFAKLATVFAILAASAQIAVATPPACLLGAVNTQDNPADLKSVCGDGAQDVKKYISSNCGDNQDAATNAFADVCKSAGVTVSSSASSSGTATKSASGTKTGSTSGTATNIPTGSLTGGYAPIGTGGASSGFMTQTANGTYSAPSATATATGANGGSGIRPSSTETGLTASSTGAASRLGMDVVGLAAVGIFGAMMAL